MYLIYADAILGNNATTSDAQALKYYNAVRTRASIAPKTSITYADIFQEKKIEFGSSAKVGRAFVEFCPFKNHFVLCPLMR